MTTSISTSSRAPAKRALASIAIAIEAPARQTVQVVTFLACAQFLSPREFGIAAIAFACTNFGATLTLSGVEAAILRRGELPASEERAITKTALAVSAVLFLVMLGVAAPLARLYGLHELLYLLPLGAVTAPLSAVSSPRRARAVRDGRYIAFLSTGLLAAVCTGAVALAVAVATHDAIALTLGQVCGVGAMALASSLVLGAPELRGASEPLAHHWRYARPIMLSDAVAYWSRNADNLIVGAILTASALGFYERSYLVILTPVAFVVLAFQRLVLPLVTRMSPQEFALTWAARVRLVAVLGGLLNLVGVTAALLARRELHGTTWAPIVPVLVVMFCVMNVHVVAGCLGSAYLAAGATSRMLFINIPSLILNLVSVAVGCLAGGSPAWAATGLLVSGLLQLPILLGLALSQLKARRLATEVSILTPVFGAVLASCALFWIVGGRT